MIDYKLEHILSFVGRGGMAPEAIGPVAEGLRVNFYNTGGEVSARAFKASYGLLEEIGLRCGRTEWPFSMLASPSRPTIMP
jgi:hypothetical protein